MDDIVALTGFSEASLRLGAFLGAFALFSLLETWVPRRKRSQSRLSRLWTNAGILVAGTILLRLIAIALPLIAAVSAASYAAQSGWGLFNLINLPPALELVLAVVILDGAIWLQHLVTHKVPLLWRLHQVHHTDKDLDASSALRFHPLEILLSSAYKVVLALLLGPSAAAIILFEILLNMSAMFNHTNLALPRWLDRILRMVIVTPDMHRVHHSIEREEHDTNYGFCLSIWDRMFRTYTREPAGGQLGMTIGLAHHQSSPTNALGWTLKLPFGQLGPAQSKQD